MINARRVLVPRHFHNALQWHSLPFFHRCPCVHPVEFRHRPSIDSIVRSMSGTVGDIRQLRRLGPKHPRGGEREREGVSSQGETIDLT